MYLTHLLAGHSMVLEPSSRTLFVFAGQRDDKYLSDMYAFDLVTNTATELYSNFTAAGGPDACFTQRAVIDPHLRELYVYVLNDFAVTEVLMRSLLSDSVGSREVLKSARQPQSHPRRPIGYIDTIRAQGAGCRSFLNPCTLPGLKTRQEPHMPWRK